MPQSVVLDQLGVHVYIIPTAENWNYLSYIFWACISRSCLSM